MRGVEKEELMSALQELIREQAQRLSQPDVKNERNLWVQHLQALILQLETWLEEADPEGILKIERTHHILREEKFGSYDASGMNIDLGGRRVEIIPRGGSVGGYTRLENNLSSPIHGMVELVNDIDRVRLFRLIDDKGVRWVIQHSGPWPAKPLDRATFEASMVQLLS